MPFNPDVHNRRSMRLKSHDYSGPGQYFVTICTHERLNVFGKVEQGKMILTPGGSAAVRGLLAIPGYFPGAKAHPFIVMPNHVHAVVEIEERARRTLPTECTLKCKMEHPKRPRGTSKTLGSIVRGYKAGVTKWFRENKELYTIWQRSYHEHIIRSRESYLRICGYIRTNPSQWEDDEYYSEDIQTP